MERELVRALGSDSGPEVSKQNFRVVVREGFPEASEWENDLMGGGLAGRWVLPAHCWAPACRLNSKSSAGP